MKKLFSSACVLSVAILVFMACHHSSSTSPAPSSTTGSSAGSTTSSTGIGGMFTVTNHYNDYFSMGTRDSGAQAAAQPNTTPAFSSIGMVMLNNDTLDDIGFGQYNTHTGVVLPNYTGHPTWKITGGGGFSAFNYPSAKAMPSPANLNIALVSFSRTSNLVINHPLITADSIKYQITDGGGNIIKKGKTVSSSSVTFTPSELAHLLPGNDATLQIMAWNFVFSTQGGKSILFNYVSAYAKDGITIN